MAKGTDQIAIAYQPIETADFTATASSAYFVDTSAGAVTVTLPASPSNGSYLKIVDYAKTFQTNFVTLNGNGEYIEGNPDDYYLNAKGTICELAYNGSAQGWKFIVYNSEESSGLKAKGYQGLGSKRYITATSDAEEVYLDGDDMVHKFLTSGTFTVHDTGTDSVYGGNVEYLIVGGGGSGGAHHGSGGGAGGYRANNAYTQSVSVQSYSIVVGAGGAQFGGDGHGNSGSSSSAFGLTCDGGGAGGGHNNGAARNGGSGGGAWHNGSHGNATGNGQGHRGGSNGHHVGGGGGGAAEPGADHYGNHMSGHGGRGYENDITGIPTHYAGGGGAAGHNHTSCPGGGEGGGGQGGGGYGINGTGGGGGGQDGTSGGHRRAGGGGDGIVVIRYRARN